MHSPIQARLELIDAPTERRRAARQSVALDARLRELGTIGVEARVLDLTADGFMASCDAPLAVGARLWLMLPGRRRANAVVRWASGGRIGAEFDQPLEPEPGC